MPGWTATQKSYKTPYGLIYYGGPCRDDYGNLETVDQFPKADGNVVLTLQRPAMKAFLAAQVRYARRSGWSQKRIAETTVRLGTRRVPAGRPIIILAGTNRTCATQAALYKRDSSRYASPAVTCHCRGLAVDRSNAQPNLGIIDACLKAEGWNKVRPDDEPWHLSYFVTA